MFDIDKLVDKRGELAKIVERVLKEVLVGEKK